MLTFGRNVSSKIWVRVDLDPVGVRTLNLVSIGTGRMAKLVEDTAAVQGHSVVARFDSASPLASATVDDLHGATVGVDFSVGEAVPDTVRAACDLGLHLVIGTTGWHDQKDEVRRRVERSGLGVVHASNFSVGVHLFYGVVERAARIFAAFDDYDPFLQEAHHRFKRDSPSGTALELRSRLEEAYGEGTVIPTTSLRAGHVPGTHTVGFDSEADTVVLEHRARSRQGFAAGALLAARWIEGRTGWFGFPDVLDDLAGPDGGKPGTDSPGPGESDP